METRTNKSIKNIYIIFCLYIATFILNFTSRTFFIKILGSEYLGISGLFTNILTILSLADLGISETIMFSLYKPLAENNYKKITALMNYYKQSFKIICLIITIIGLIFVPFLKYIIKSEIPIDKIYTYYILYLINTITSYLFVYKSIIIKADQKIYLLKISDTIVVIFKVVLEILILIFTKNFILYLIIRILSTLLYNLLVSYRAKKLYPYINNKETLTKIQKKEIFNNIKSMFSYKLGNTLITNTDNILISILISTIMVGYYSNYFILIASLTNFTNIFIWSVQGSFGNFNVDSSCEEKRKKFYTYEFSLFLIYGFTSICFYILSNDFISLWIGTNYILQSKIVFIIAINYFFTGIFNSIIVYRQTTNLFNKTKNCIYFTVIINIILSIFLCNYLGLFGILLATIISNILTIYWYEPYKLFEEYFKEPIFKFIKKLLYQLFTLVIIVAIIFIATRFIITTNWGIFIIKSVICTFLCIIFLTIFYFENKEFKYIYNMFKCNIKNKRGIIKNDKSSTVCQCNGQSGDRNNIDELL